MTTWTLSLRDDLTALQHPEDGSEFTASVFYIVATNERGERFAHDYRFHSAETYDNEYGMGIRSFRDEAEAKAKKLLAKMEATLLAGTFVSPVGRAHWAEIDAEYGSIAYQELEPEMIARERAEG